MFLIFLIGSVSGILTAVSHHHFHKLFSRDKDFSRLLPGRLAYKTELLHPVDQLRRSSVSERQLALNQRSGDLAGGNSEFKCIAEHRIVVRFGRFALERSSAAFFALSDVLRRLFDFVYNVLGIRGVFFVLILNICDYVFNVSLVDKRTLNTDRLRRADRKIEHIALPYQVFRARAVEYRARVDLRGDR